ncbi:hypothetical protein [Tianweitania sediminis]|uniref:Uncharacterized protein n=1 Tax=Tianweitania sediminis TaxID=1502156 RepID=A0A8J7R4P8_9HYPH|nr:hypothetical protein [Tianweitania sediminis]MBP0440746.1 hypothetical protein [Tianweitania sediminis]HEV7414535.1 hypothetical protein [Tianweitania sediminis]
MGTKVTGCRTVIIAGLALISTAAAAAQRPDVTRMSCQQAQRLVAEAGAVVATTGPRTYQRFVSDKRFCDAGEDELHPAYTDTADKRCLVGYTCESWNLYFPDRD